MLTARKILLSVLLLWAAAATAQRGGDLQAQILYAYQTEDANRLDDLVQNITTLVKADSADASLRYHLAHAQYRLGRIIGDAQTAEAAFADCAGELKPVLQQDVKSVEALALQSACYCSLASFRKFEAVLLRARAADRLKAAFHLAPRNPRVIFLLGQEELARAIPGSVEQQHAFAQLQLAAQLFDASSATSIDTPGWGHAEAYLVLGRELQSRGDLLAARNWIEKSLIVAPDYKAAQRQLALLTHP